MDLKKRIFNIHSEKYFETICLEVFRYQSVKCNVYKKYLQLLGISPASIKRIQDIPFLPIELFKTHQIITTEYEAELVFSSSGTTGITPSKHYVADRLCYEESFLRSFIRFYGEPTERAVLALLPSYLERQGSSLIYMVDDLIKRSKHQTSGYFLYNHTDLYNTLATLKERQVPTLLIGVTYALLDFVADFTIDFPSLIVMETGGMKGKRNEMIRQEVHNELKSKINVSAIHSEYGMTELLSQAYAKADGIFECPPWMRVLARETNDPFHMGFFNRNAALNIIDLANIYSCSFIATQDLGIVYPDNRFEVIGRFDNSDIRGCNLMVQ